mmetsp:Transcript_14217/g.48939  ORF Transcript_14217/g.48939 Transcript_14217/m.48939 type:complete len:490 (+) Transcript_14217:1-1470(+)
MASTASSSELVVCICASRAPRASRRTRSARPFGRDDAEEARGWPLQQAPPARDGAHAARADGLRHGVVVGRPGARGAGRGAGDGDVAGRVARLAHEEARHRRARRAPLLRVPAAVRRRRRRRVEPRGRRGPRRHARRRGARAERRLRHLRALRPRRPHVLLRVVALRLAGRARGPIAPPHRLLPPARARLEGRRGPVARGLGRFLDRPVAGRGAIRRGRRRDVVARDRPRRSEPAEAHVRGRDGDPARPRAHALHPHLLRPQQGRLPQLLQESPVAVVPQRHGFRPVVRVLAGPVEPLEDLGPGGRRRGLGRLRGAEPGLPGRAPRAARRGRHGLGPRLPPHAAPVAPRVVGHVQAGRLHEAQGAHRLLPPHPLPDVPIVLLHRARVAAAHRFGRRGRRRLPRLRPRAPLPQRLQAPHGHAPQVRAGRRHGRRVRGAHGHGRRAPRLRRAGQDPPRARGRRDAAGDRGAGPHVAAAHGEEAQGRARGRR